MSCLSTELLLIRDVALIVACNVFCIRVVKFWCEPPVFPALWIFFSSKTLFGFISDKYLMMIIAHLWRNISYHFIISIEWGLEQTLNPQSTHMSIESWVNIMSRKVNTRHHSMKGKLLMTQTLWTLKFHNFNKNHWWKRTEQLVSERRGRYRPQLIHKNALKCFNSNEKFLRICRSHRLVSAFLPDFISTSSLHWGPPTWTNERLRSLGCGPIRGS